MVQTLNKSRPTAESATQSASTQNFSRRLQALWRFAVERARQERILQVSSSLTFTTALALVPLLAVGLALFTAFPLFESYRGALEDWFFDSLLPEEISENVMRYLTEFAGKAGRVGALGGLFLMGTAVSLMLTVDRCVNEIFKVSKPRPLVQRVLVYWAVLTLGPLVLGASLWATGMAVAASRGLVGIPPNMVQFILSVLPVAIMGGALASSFVVVPNCKVFWKDALVGGMLAALGFELMKRGFAAYITTFDATAVYGPFALLPVLLMWIYLTWVVILFGATLAATMPVLRARAFTTDWAQGSEFLDTLSTLLQMLDAQRQQLSGVTLQQLCDALHRSPQHMRSVLDQLCQLNYCARLEVQSPNGTERYALICDANTTTLAALIQMHVFSSRALSEHPQASAALERLWPQHYQQLTLAQLSNVETDVPSNVLKPD